MKKFHQNRFKILSFCLLVSLLMATIQKSMSQQLVGLFPNIDAGFESQAAGNLGTTQSATAWTYVSSGSTQSRAISASGGYGGPKFVSVGRGNTTSNTSTTINSNQITTGTFPYNTTYIVQFHFKQSAGFTGIPDPASYVFISPDGTSSGRITTPITLGTPPASWTKFTTTVAIAAPATVAATTGTCGINIKNQATPLTATTVDIDNFVVYPADNQTTPVPDITAPSPASNLVATGNPAVVDLTWSAPASGVDGGGYVVVRFNADPVAEPNLLQNAVYKADASNTIGTTGTVVYVGTNTSCSDGSVTPGVNYWYRVYTVDKAFNYSASIVTGPVSPVSKSNYYYDGTGSTADVLNWWTNKNGTGSNPPNFTSSGQIFRIITNADLVSTLSISGIGSSLIIGDPSPVPAMTIHFNTSVLPGIDTVYQSSDGNPVVLNFNTSAVPSINQLLEIFAEVHYRAPGISVGTSKTYDKIFVENNGDVVFNGTPAVTTSFKVEEGATATIGTLSSRWLKVNDGATVTINGKLITPKLVGLVSSNVGSAASTFGAIQFITAGDVLLGPNSTIEYSGISSTTTQTVTPRTDYNNVILSGTGVSKTFSGATIINGSLTLNTSGATGAILAGGELNVKGNLVLTNGKINSDATNILVLSNASNVSGGSNASHVVGPMKKNTDASSFFTFPVGKGGFYHPVGITPSSNTPSLYEAEYFNAAYSSLLVDASLTAVSNTEYWDVSRTSGASAAITLSLDGITPVPGATANDGLVVAHFDGANWVSVNQTPIIPGDAISGSAVSTVLNNFSPFTFGIKPLSALPVKLVSFHGSLENKQPKLQWTTSGEINVNKYIVEQSTDGRNFTEIGFTTARNAVGLQSYTYYHQALLLGNSYFRLKIIDNDGHNTYSSVVLLKSSGKNNITLIGNPARGNHIQFQLDGFAKGNYVIQLFNTNGQLLQQQSLLVDGTAIIQQLNIKSTSTKGLVILKIVGNNTSEEVRLLLL